MTVLTQETFEGGSNGAAVTTANTSFDTVTGSAWTFSNAQVLNPGGDVLSGRCSLSTSGVSEAQSNLTASAVVYSRLYLYVATMPSATHTIASVRGASALRADMRIQTTGVLQIRNSGGAQVAATPAGFITAGGWVRVEWMYNNTTGRQQLRVFKNANVHGTVPDFDSGVVVTAAAGTADQLVVGIISAAAATYFVDNIIVDNAGFPDPVVVGAAERIMIGGTWQPARIVII